MAQAKQTTIMKKPTVDTETTATVEVFVAGIPFVQASGAYTWDIPVNDNQRIEVLDFGETWEGESGVLVYAVVSNG